MGEKIYTDSEKDTSRLIITWVLEFEDNIKDRFDWNNIVVIILNLVVSNT